MISIYLSPPYRLVGTPICKNCCSRMLYSNKANRWPWHAGFGRCLFTALPSHREWLVCMKRQGYLPHGISPHIIPNARTHKMNIYALIHDVFRQELALGTSSRLIMFLRAQLAFILLPVSLVVQGGLQIVPGATWTDVSHLAHYSAIMSSFSIFHTKLLAF
jgi:hypothetical protein